MGEDGHAFIYIYYYTTVSYAKNLGEPTFPVF